MSSMFRLCALLLFVFTSLAVEGQGPESRSGSTALPDKVLQMLKTQIALDQGLNHPDGPRLRFVKVDDMNRNGQIFHRYRVYAEGAPRNTPLILTDWRIGTTLENMQVLSNQAYVNNKGLLLLNKPKPGQEDAEAVSDGSELDVATCAAEGEPSRFVLRTQDSTVMIPGTLVIFPIQVESRSCKLTALLGAPNAEAVLMYLDGLAPNAEMPFESDSEGEAHKGKFVADAHGHAVAVTLPYVTGKDSGVLNFRVVSDSCQVTVKVPWGKGSYHPQ